jgi:tRNA pseudouridine38-40 synthase
MKRILLTVAYDGTSYHGWQLQGEQPTIERELNRVLSEMTGEDIQVSGASRTDAGVHSLCNLAVFDTEARMPGDKYSYAMNVRLPKDIRIRESREVSMDFHPRTAKTEKTYCYRIYTDKFPNPLERLYSYYTYFELDHVKMNEGIQYLIGEHDFKSFCSVHTQAKTTVREITDARVVRDGNEIKIFVSGYGFLYNMVRIIAGTLMQIGRGKGQPCDVKQILEKKSRAAAGPTAPPQGLFLINYNFLDGIPKA